LQLLGNCAVSLVVYLAKHDRVHSAKLRRAYSRASGGSASLNDRSVALFRRNNQWRNASQACHADHRKGNDHHHSASRRRLTNPTPGEIWNQKYSKSIICCGHISSAKSHHGCPKPATAFLDLETRGNYLE